MPPAFVRRTHSHDELGNASGTAWQAHLGAQVAAERGWYDEDLQYIQQCHEYDAQWGDEQQRHPQYAAGSAGQNQSHRHAPTAPRFVTGGRLYGRSQVQRPGLPPLPRPVGCASGVGVDAAGYDAGHLGRQHPPVASGSVYWHGRGPGPRRSYASVGASRRAHTRQGQGLWMGMGGGGGASIKPSTHRRLHIWAAVSRLRLSTSGAQGGQAAGLSAHAAMRRSGCNAKRRCSRYSGYVCDGSGCHCCTEAC